MARPPIERVIPSIGDPIGYVDESGVIRATEQMRRWMEGVEQQMGGEGVDAIAEQGEMVEQVVTDTETVTQVAQNLETQQANLDLAVQTAQAAAATAQGAAGNAQTAANNANNRVLEVENRIDNYSGTGPIP